MKLTDEQMAAVWALKRALDQDAESIEKQWKRERKKWPTMALRTFATNRLFSSSGLGGIVGWFFTHPELHGEWHESRSVTHLSAHPDLECQVEIRVRIQKRSATGSTGSTAGTFRRWGG